MAVIIYLVTFLASLFITLLPFLIGGLVALAVLVGIIIFIVYLVKKDKQNKEEQVQKDEQPAEKTEGDAE